MKERKKIIIALIAVTLILIIAGGSTFAYWYWTTATNEQTAVNLIVNDAYIQNQLNATISGATQNITNMIPVASCTDSTYAIKKEITLTYKNDTDNEAIVRGTLTVSDFTSPHGTPNTSALGHLHYAVTTSATNCTTSVVTGASGTFGTTNGALFSNVPLKSGIPAYTATSQTQTYYLWVWIDSDYYHQNVGSGTVSDPMQDLSFNLSWSGTISNET